MPLIDDTDFKTREESVTFDQSGLDLLWNFVTTAGAFTQTAVTPTDTGGDYDFINKGNGLYTMEIPASGGASINNDTEGFGWFSGFATGILPWRGPVCGFRAAALNNSLVDGPTVDVNVTAMAADTITAAAIKDAAIDAATFAADAITSTVIADAAITAAKITAMDAAGWTNLEALAKAFVLTTAVIETVTDQTNFILPATADAVADNAYHGAIAVFIDAGDANNKSFQVIENYTASTRSLEVARAPTFTVTNSDTITILATTDAGGVWDMILTGSKHNINTSAGKRLRQVEEAFVHASGTIANVGDGHTATLDTGAVATAAYYVGDRLQITEGTGLGQSRLIIKYTSGRICTLDSNWITNPDTSSLYDVVAADVHVSISDADLAEGFIAAAGSTTSVTLDATIAVATTDYYKGDIIVFTHGTGAGQSREITAYSSGRVVTMSPALVTAVSTDTVFHIVAAPSIPEIVDEVWDRDATSNQTGGTFGQAIGDPGANTETIYDAVITDAAGTNVAADVIAVDTVVDAIPTTAMRGTDSANTVVPPSVAQFNARTQPTADYVTAADILTTALTESYAANGVDPTLTEALLAVHQKLMAFAISSTSVSVKKLDGSTEAFVGTLDDATAPTEDIRA